MEGVRAERPIDNDRWREAHGAMAGGLRGDLSGGLGRGLSRADTDKHTMPFKGVQHQNVLRFRAFLYNPILPYTLYPYMGRWMTYIYPATPTHPNHPVPPQTKSKLAQAKREREIV